MKLLLVVLFAIFVHVFADECPENEKVVVCYVESWAVYRADNASFPPSKIDPHLCTHVIYAFAGLGLENEIYVLDSNSDLSLGGFAQVNALKEENPCLKTLLAIGGWSQGSRRFSVMVSTEEGRKLFVESVIMFLSTYDFDGLDFDWEYPTQRGGIPQDKENFGKLLKLLHERFQPWGMLLTIAVPIANSIISAGYDMEAISQYVDYVLIMGYDYTSIMSEVTGLLSPLPAMKETVDFWLESVPSTKIVLGVPAYGRSYTLLNRNNNGIGAPTNGTGEPGQYTKEAGMLSYYEVMSKLSTLLYKLVQTPEGDYYAYFGTDWITFELEDNYQNKARYIKESNLGGIMIWTVDTEDFVPMYNKTSFPILTATRKILFDEE